MAEVQGQPESRFNEVLPAGVRPIAEPITHYVWCLSCGGPHQANLVKKVIFIFSSETCCEYGEWETVQTLPKGWERDFNAEYRNGAYRLIPKAVPLLNGHRPMYYLTTEADT